MTKAIPQIMNTKTALRAAAQALPDTAHIQALLGLDGDCDFSVRASEAHPFRCSKDELLSLIDRQVQEELSPMAQFPDYLVLARRYAVFVPELVGEHTISPFCQAV